MISPDHITECRKATSRSGGLYRRFQGRILLFLLILLPFLASCDYEERWIVHDAVWDSLVREEFPVELFISVRSVITPGVRYKLIVLEETLDAEAQMAFWESGIKMAASPLAGRWLIQASGDRNPDLVILGADPETVNDPVRTISIDRTEAFFDAGAFAGLFTSGQNGYCAAYFFTSTEKRRDERDAFVEGFNSTGEASALLIHSYTDFNQNNFSTFDNVLADKTVVLYAVFASKDAPELLKNIIFRAQPFLGEYADSYIKITPALTGSISYRKKDLYRVLIEFWNSPEDEKSGDVQAFWKVNDNFRPLKKEGE